MRSPILGAESPRVDSLAPAWLVASSPFRGDAARVWGSWIVLGPGVKPGQRTEGTDWHRLAPPPPPLSHGRGLCSDSASLPARRVGGHAVPAFMAWASIGPEDPKLPTRRQRPRGTAAGASVVGVGCER